MAAAFDRALQSVLPLPLARLYARAFHAKGERERHDHAFHLVETSLKLAAAALVGRYRTAGVRSDKVDAVLRHLAMPSLGQWRDIFRETLLFLGTRPSADPWSAGIFARITAPGCYEHIEGIVASMMRVVEFRGRRPQTLAVLDAIELLPSYRNAMSDAHGAVKADIAAYEEGTGALLDLARLLAAEADVLGGGHLLFAEEVKFTPAGDHEIVWMDLTGPTAIRRQPGDRDTAPSGQPAVLPGRLYLEIEPEEHISLHPLLHYQPGEIVDQVYYLNRARGGRSGIQFLCYATGEFYLPGRDPHGDRLVADLEELLSWITAGHVDAVLRAQLGEASRLDAAAREKAPEEDAGAAPAGRTFGDFEIIGELGCGGMAVVYLARQMSLGRLVALKMLPLALREDPVAVARFTQEVRALARCDHPNVVKILTSGQAEGTYYYAMEYVDGPNLAAVIRALTAIESQGTHALREGHLRLAVTTAGRAAPRDHVTGLPQADTTIRESVPDVASGRDINLTLAALMRDAARGVHHVHEQGIIHRDVKPQNIMVTRAALQPVVMDLGLAKVAGASVSLSIDKTRIVGTLRYMAPEQIERNLLEVDARADVYSLGVVLYELTCRRLMFDGDTEQRLSHQVLFEAPVPPRKANPRLPGDLATIIEKATRKDRRERYASAAELADDLDRFVRGEAIAARPLSICYLAQLFLARHWRAIAAGTAAVIVLAVAMYVRDRQRSVAEFSAHFNAGEEAWTRYGVLKDDLVKWKQEWEAADAAHETWLPVWERRTEIDAWRRYATTHSDMENAYNEAVLSFERARTVKGLGRAHVRAAEESIGRAYFERYRDAEREGAVTLGPEFFKGLLGSLGNDTYVEEIRGGGSMQLQSEPPGAEVHLFRYVAIEERLVPLPFDVTRFPPGDGAPPADAIDGCLAGRPYLEVERVWNPNPGGAATPFKENDRLVSAHGWPAATRTDLAAALRNVEADATVDVEVLRGGATVALRWTPFPASIAEKSKGALPPGRVRDPAVQFGIEFKGYPLESLDACRMGVTRDDVPLSITLPRGSYLLLLRKAGYVETRVPVTMPLQRGSAERVRLLPESAVPPDFVYIPAGMFSYGGDNQASQSLDFGEARLPGFLMARFEVTIPEYLEFLNDPAVASRIDRETGMAAPRADWQAFRAKGLIAPAVPDGPADKVRLIPVLWGTPFFAFDKASGRWSVGEANKDYATGQYPLFGASMLMAAEYAAWRSEKHGTWRFRLPTDLEWEKAARGTGRRIFVWGDYPVWCHCSSVKGDYRRSTPKRIGRYPMDESIFGVRDMAGSLCEPTTDKTTLRYRYVSLRGGNWNTTEDQYFRIANRNGLPSEEHSMDMGIRLVADIEPPEP